MSCEIKIENIRKYRKLKGLSQERLAEMVGVSKSTIEKIENGKVSPRVKVLEDISDILGICPFDLMECECKDRKDGTKCSNCCKKCERYKCNRNEV